MARKKQARTGRPRRRAGTKGKTKGRTKTKTKRTATKTRRRAAGGRAPEALLGPPPAEALLIRGDRERAAERLQRGEPAANPRLTGGDVDADWQRAASTGEEAVGGSVVTPDQDVVDELGEALGVPHAPDEPFRASQEVLEKRDAKRFSQEG